MQLETLKEILEAHQPSTIGYVLKRDRKFGLELVGPCPMCEPQHVVTVGIEQKIVNEDRFHAWLHPDGSGLICWWCRHAKHDFTQKALFAFLGVSDDGDYSKHCRLPETALLQVPNRTMFDNGKFTFKAVDFYFDSRTDYVRDYWAKWGIDDQMVEEMRLGYIDFKMDDGRRFAGFTIPHFYHTGEGDVLIKGVHIRRDDAVEGNGIKHKYHAMRGSNLAGLYYDKSFCLPDETRIAGPLDVALLCEDERTANCLNTYLRQQKIPRVAASAYHPEAAWDKFLGRAVKNSLLRFVLADNDGVAGLNYATKVQKAAGPGTMTLMHPDFKQLSDMAAARGLNAAGDWLMEAIEERIMA